jgi:hypothetical protein
MQNQQADFAEIRRISHISLNFSHEICARRSRASVVPLPLTAKNPNATVARIYVEVRKMRFP